MPDRRKLVNHSFQVACRQFKCMGEQLNIKRRRSVSIFHVIKLGDGKSQERNI